MKIKNKTKKAPIGVSMDFATDHKTVDRLPEKSCEKGEMRASRERSAELAPNTVLTLANLTFMERRGREAMIIKKGTKIIPRPKRL